MSWAPEHRIIRIELFDSETLKAIGGARVKAEQLPARFDPGITMEIGGVDYAVIRAHPITAEEFRKGGRLQLVLRRLAIGSHDPAKALSAAPTICEALPPLVPGLSSGDTSILELRGDDWRQVEFVAASLRPEIEEEFAAIWQVYDDHREGPGFNQVHARKRPAGPLGLAGVDFESVRQLAGSGDKWYDALAIRELPGQFVEGGFAAKLECGIDLYGRCENERVVVVCLRIPDVSAGVADVAAIAGLAQRFDLVLVDWCRVLRLEPAADDFREYFASAV